MCACYFCVLVCVFVHAGCGPAPPEHGQGRVLQRDDPALFDISVELAFDMQDLRQFAAHLLHDSGCRWSSSAFLATLSSSDYATVHSKTYALLQYW